HGGREPGLETAQAAIFGLVRRNLAQASVEIAALGAVVPRGELGLGAEIDHHLVVAPFAFRREQIGAEEALVLAHRTEHLADRRFVLALAPRLRLAARDPRDRCGR